MKGGMKGRVPVKLSLAEEAWLLKTKLGVFDDFEQDRNGRQRP
jgi:hypothetical protein